MLVKLHSCSRTFHVLIEPRHLSRGILSNSQHISPKSLLEPATRLAFRSLYAPYSRTTLRRLSIPVLQDAHSSLWESSTEGKTWFLIVDSRHTNESKGKQRIQDWDKSRVDFKWKGRKDIQKHVQIWKTVYHWQRIEQHYVLDACLLRKRHPHWENYKPIRLADPVSKMIVCLNLWFLFADG